MAVVYLHSNKVVHRDLKLDNFVVDGDHDLANSANWFKVADFGLSLSF